MAKVSTKSSDNEFEEVELGKDDLQIDQIPKTYVLLNKYWDTIEKNLPRNYNKLLRFIASYRNKFINILETPYPINYPPWGFPATIKIIYEVCGIEESEFVEDVLTIRGLDDYIDTYLRDKAPYILLIMIVRWMIMHDYEKERKVIEHYIGYAHYWAAFTSIFKTTYKPKLEIMKYTISEMSYKSRLKAVGSVDLWLYDGVSNTINAYDKRIMRASDFELHYINEKLRGKFKSAMKTIYRAYTKNEKEKKYIFTSKSNVDGEIVDNTYGVAEVLSVASAYTTKFFATPIDEKALNDCLVPGGISKGDLRNVILQIANDNGNFDDVKKLFQSLFYLFLENDKYTIKDIGTLRFYYEMEKLYKPGNSNDPNKNYIKEILDKWLAMGSPTFRTTNRTATITTFRKCIYNYFVLKIMKDK